MAVSVQRLLLVSEGTHQASGITAARTEVVLPSSSF